MGWGMGNDFKEATQAATPDLARAYALQGQLDNAAQARVDAVRANNAAGIIGLGEKGFSEYKDWKDKQPVKPVQMGGPLQGLAPYQAPNTGVLPDGYNMESMISDFGSGAAPTPSPASLAPSQDMQMPDGFSDGVTPQYNPSALKKVDTARPFIRPETGDAISNAYGDYNANKTTAGEAYDSYQNWAKGVNERANSLRNDVVGMFSDDEVPTSGFMGGRTVTNPAEIDKIGSAIDIESMNPAMKAQLMNSIGMPDVGADIGADVAEDATLDAASTALDGLGGTAGVSALEGILSGDDAGTIAKDVTLDAGQAALLSSLGLTGPLGWGVGALISALRA